MRSHVKTRPGDQIPTSLHRIDDLCGRGLFKKIMQDYLDYIYSLEQNAVIFDGHDSLVGRGTDHKIPVDICARIQNHRRLFITN
jgi:hypothetical protein